MILTVYLLTIISVIFAMVVSVLAIIGEISLKVFILLGIMDIVVMATAYILACQVDKQKKSPSDGNPKGDKEK